MDEHSPFDHRPDPDMGEALRDVLTAPDDAAFVRRVLARVGAPPTSWWEVLDTWARPGIAAAIVLAALMGFLLGRSVGAGGQSAALDEPIQAVAEGVGVAALFTAARPPDVNAVLTAANGSD